MKCLSFVLVILSHFVIMAQNADKEMSISEYEEHFKDRNLLEPYYFKF